MSLKFPDMQVLIGRTDQIPKILREGDPTGAGKVNPVIVQQYAERPKKVSDSPKTARIRNQKKEKPKRAAKGSRRRNSFGGSLDIRI